MSKDPGMEKNYFFALALSMLVLLGYPMFLRWLNPAAYKPKPVASQKETPAGDSALSKITPPEKIYGSIETPGKPAEPSVIQYSNDLYDLKFSTLGATISELSYKGEKNKAHMDYVPFFNGDSHAPGLFALTLLNDQIDLSQSIFKLNRKSDQVFDFVYEKPGDYKITKTYLLDPVKPVILMTVTMENLSPREKHFPLQLTIGLYDGDVVDPRQIGLQAVVYQDKVKMAHAKHIQKKGFLVTGDIQWAGLLKKYFALLVRPEWKLISNENKADDKNLWGTLLMEPLTVGPGQKTSKEIFIYAGPQRYEILKSFGMDFEAILSNGVFGLFKIWLLIALKFLNQFTHNYGWAIILMTLLLKFAFAPLTHMSYESMRKMQAIQPKLKSLQERYKKDPTKMNREVMDLYKRNKVNPMGGCLPMVAQIPVFIAFYQVLNETIELKGAPFIMWIHDLAEPDKLFHLPFSLPVLGDAFNLLPLFMIGSMFWQQKLTPQPGTSTEQAQAMQFMPLIFGFLFYKMPSGLVLYWFLNNILTVFHQLVIKRMGAVVLHHEDLEQ